MEIPSSSYKTFRHLCLSSQCLEVSRLLYHIGSLVKVTLSEPNPDPTPNPGKSFPIPSFFLLGCTLHGINCACVCVSVYPAEWNHPQSWAHSMNLALTPPFSPLPASFHFLFPVCLSPNFSSSPYRSFTLSLSFYHVRPSCLIPLLTKT